MIKERESISEKCGSKVFTWIKNLSESGLLNIAFHRGMGSDVDYGFLEKPLNLFLFSSIQEGWRDRVVSSNETTTIQVRNNKWLESLFETEVNFDGTSYLADFTAKFRPVVEVRADDKIFIALFITREGNIIVISTDFWHGRRVEVSGAIIRWLINYALVLWKSQSFRITFADIPDITVPARVQVNLSLSELDTKTLTEAFLSSIKDNIIESFNKRLEEVRSECSVANERLRRSILSILRSTSSIRAEAERVAERKALKKFSFLAHETERLRSFLESKKYRYTTNFGTYNDLLGVIFDVKLNLHPTLIRYNDNLYKITNEQFRKLFCIKNFRIVLSLVDGHVYSYFKGVHINGRCESNHKKYKIQVNETEYTLWLLKKPKQFNTFCWGEVNSYQIKNVNWETAFNSLNILNTSSAFWSWNVGVIDNGSLYPYDMGSEVWKNFLHGVAKRIDAVVTTENKEEEDDE